MAAHAKRIEIAIEDRPVLEKLAGSRTAERRLVDRAVGRRGASRQRDR